MMERWSDGKIMEIFGKLKNTLSLKKYPFLQKAMPMVAFCGLSSFGLSFLTQTMVEKRSARKNIMSYKEAEEKLGISMVSKEEREEKKRRQERTGIYCIKTTGRFG